MSGEITQGRRLPDATFGVDGPGWQAWRTAQAGDYMLVDYDGSPNLWLLDPDGRLGRLETHRIIENEDGTITATPSINDLRMYTTDDLRAAGIASIVPHGPAGTPGWHGYLTAGVWRSC